MMAETKIYEKEQNIVMSNPVVVQSGINHKNETYLQWILASQQVNDLESVFHNANRHQLLTVVATSHHERVGQTFNDWALSLTETLDGETSSRVRQITSVFLFHGNVILESNELELVLNSLNHKLLQHTCNDMSET